MTTLPLAGVRVADFSWFGAGPIAGQILANHGAEVIRVESEAHVDGLRIAAPLKPGVTGSYNVSGYYNNFNANKLSLTLNMGKPQARELALKLIAKCDVVMENYTPRVFEKWGLTYEAMCDVNPAVIFARLPMQGVTGPHRDFLGFGAVLTPLAGISYLSGIPHRPPVGLGTNYPDYVINPGHVAIAILAALRHKRLTGEGQFIEVAQLESTASVIGPALMDYAVNGRIQERTGNRHPAAAPHGAFPCVGEDRWCVIACSTDAEWQGLCAALDDPPWTRTPEFATLHARKANEDELEARIAEWTRTQVAEELMERLQSVGVPCGVVQNARDILEGDRHIQARAYYRYLDHPETGRAAYDSPGFRLSRTPPEPERPAPLLGEHTEYVCKEIIGLSDEEIAALVAEQVLY